MKRSFQLRAVAFGLAHLLTVLVLLHLGVEWGNFHDPGSLLLHLLLFPGEDIYFVLAPDTAMAALVTYPLNSALWGLGLAWLWRRCRRRGDKTLPS